MLFFYSLILLFLHLPGTHTASDSVLSHKTHTYLLSSDNDHWLQIVAQTATSAEFESSPGYDFVGKNAVQVTGIPEWYTANTANHSTICRLLTTLHCSSHLTMTDEKGWNNFYHKHLARCPELDIVLDYENRSKSESLRLFLYQAQGHYWLQRESSHPTDDGYVTQDGGVAIDPHSLHRFLHLLRTKLIQGKHGKSDLRLSDYGRYGN